MKQIFRVIYFLLAFVCSMHLGDTEAVLFKEVSLEDVYSKLEQLEKQEQQHHQHLQDGLKRQEQLLQEILGQSQNASDDGIASIVERIEALKQGAMEEKAVAPPVEVVECKNKSEDGGCYPQDCSEVTARDPDNPDGVYTIYIGEYKTPISVYCKLKGDGAGWLVFQRRTNGTLKFYRDWEEYTDGFGHPSQEYWLGLENLHQITSQRDYELGVEMSYFMRHGFAFYDYFSVDGAANNYKLHLGTFVEGTAGDSLSQHSGQPFSTWDNDNDNSKLNCAAMYRGAWWYHSCHHSNLNGEYKAGPALSPKGIVWRSFEKWRVVKRTEMMIRPVTPPAD